MLRRLRSEKKRCRLVLSVTRGTFTSSDLRQAEVRVRRRRAAALAVGAFAPGREQLEALFREARAAGFCGRRKLVTMALSVDHAVAEAGMWWSGAHTVGEFVKFALLRAVLAERPRRMLVRKVARRRR